ncbi:hypothetical protein [Clavibacter michiganensis]|uniref:hypothetical protein n=1 Tax=Clavibacter michiganensis TaxID=28447 RepID=UPI002931BB33|nr:hypothetical protein [Clavibacter michiganensis]
MHEDDDAVSALPVEELRRRVYAQGADETDERWIRTPAVSSTLTRQPTLNGTSSSRSFTLPS